MGLIADCRHVRGRGLARLPDRPPRAERLRLLPGHGPDPVSCLPGLVMASGVLGVTPLTGVVTPFLSYGGSAMLANFAALGMLAAIHAAAIRRVTPSRSACR